MIQLSIVIINILSDRSKNPYATSLPLKAVLLQLKFPSFLGESARAAAPRTKTITKRVPTNVIALTGFLASAELRQVGQYELEESYPQMYLVNIRTYLHDPTITSDIERAVNEAVAVVCLAATS